MYQSISSLEVLAACMELGKKKTFKLLKTFDSSDALCVSVTRSQSKCYCIDRHGLSWEIESGYEELDKYTLTRNPDITTRAKRGDLKLYDKDLAILYMDEVISHITHGMKLQKR